MGFPEFLCISASKLIQIVFFIFLDGLAFKMEHGFQRTEMGRQAYAMNLAIITQAVLRTVCEFSMHPCPLLSVSLTLAQNPQ